MSILVAIGNDVDAQLAARLLAALNQPIVVAHTVADAERHATADSFDVAVVDVESLDGEKSGLVRTLARERSHGLIVVLSPSTDIMDKVQALDDGADDYLVYPYEPAELVARVRAALRRQNRSIHRSQGGIVRAGSVQLDVNKLEVSLPGRQHVRLTPNEMRLLLYLMTHPERAIAQHELLTHLFGPDAEQIASNAVGVYMRRVRLKIEDNPDEPRYVVTVRGHGYQFKAPTGEDTLSPVPVLSPS